MKKIFTLVAMAVASVAANAQVESAFVNLDLIPLDADGKTTTVTLEADQTLCESDNVVMKNAYKCDYKRVSITAEADVANQVTIDDELIDIAGNTGIQGQTNPADNSLGTLKTASGISYWSGGQYAGAVCKFEVNADGYLFVFHKASYNKNYFAWAGRADLGTGSCVAIRHIGVPVKAENGGAYDFTMPHNANGFFEDGPNADGSATTCLGTAQIQDKDDAGNPLWKKGEGTTTVESEADKDDKGKAIKITHPETTLAQLYELLGKTNFTAGNSLSVIAIPVRKAAKTYFVNACGSKISVNGFAFIPSDGTPSYDDLNAIEVSFSKAGETAVAGVAEAKAEVAAPVKVLGANGIQIGNYNIAGQQVK